MWFALYSVAATAVTMMARVQFLKQVFFFFQLWFCTLDMIIFQLIPYFLKKICEYFHAISLERIMPWTPTPCHLGVGIKLAHGSGSTQSCIFKEGLFIVIIIY